MVIIALLLCWLLTNTGCSKRHVVYSPNMQHGKSQRVQVYSAGDMQSALKTFYNRWKGTPYGMGGISRSSIDCSGLTVLAYKEIFGLDLPRTVAEQAKSGKKISRGTLRAGDLVFFKIGIFQQHVGIYLENNRFFHASASQGVMISDLNSPYWKKQYWKATRHI